MVVGLQPKPTDEDICIELMRHGGRLYWTAKALGCSSLYVRQRIRECPQVQEAYRDSKDEVVDLAEQVMYNRLKDGSETAARYILSTLGKDRGYTERTEVVGKGGGAINVTLSLGREQKNFDEEVTPPEGLDLELDSVDEPIFIEDDPHEFIG